MPEPTRDELSSAGSGVCVLTSQSRLVSGRGALKTQELEQTFGGTKFDQPVLPNLRIKPAFLFNDALLQTFWASSFQFYR